MAPARVAPDPRPNIPDARVGLLEKAMSEAITALAHAPQTVDPITFVAEHLRRAGEHHGQVTDTAAVANAAGNAASATEAPFQPPTAVAPVKPPSGNPEWSIAKWLGSLGDVNKAISNALIVGKSVP